MPGSLVGETGILAAGKPVSNRMAVGVQMRLLLRSALTSSGWLAVPIWYGAIFVYVWITGRFLRCHEGLWPPGDAQIRPFPQSECVHEPAGTRVRKAA